MFHSFQKKECGLKTKNDLKKELRFENFHMVSNYYFLCYSYQRYKDYANSLDKLILLQVKQKKILRLEETVTQMEDEYAGNVGVRTSPLVGESN